MFFEQKLKVVIPLLKITSSWNDESDGKLTRYMNNARISFNVFILFLTMGELFVTDMHDEGLGLRLYYLALEINCNAQSLHLRSNFKTGISVYRQIEELMEDHKHEKEMISKETSKGWNYVKWYSMSCVVFSFMFVILPYIYELVVLIFGLDLALFHPSLPLDGFLVLLRERSPEYVFLRFIGVLWSVSTTTVACGNYSISGVLLSYYSLEIKVLQDKFKKLGQTINDHAKNTLMVEREIIKTIKIHQKLIRLSEDVNLYIGFTFAVQCTLISVAICLLIYSCLTTNNVTLLYTYSVLFFNMGILAAVPCILGQDIETKGEQLLESIYEVPWDRLIPKHRRYLSMCLLQAERGLKIDFKRLMSTNYETLLQIMNTSYSYTMVMKSLL